MRLMRKETTVLKAREECFSDFRVVCVAWTKVARPERRRFRWFVCADARSSNDRGLKKKKDSSALGERESSSLLGRTSQRGGWILNA